MIRMTLALLAVTMLVSAAPVSAQTMNCKEEMTKAEPMMNAMTDKTKQASAMKEMDMAKEMMGKNDEKGCMTHMQNAMGMMK